MTESSPAPPVVPVPAATLMLLRDGPAGLEVLMMVRHDATGFAGGAMVFPGGKVDPADHAFAARCEPAADALKIAAIRETYEECGILLARRAGRRVVLSQAEAGALAATAGDADLTVLLAANGLEPALDQLVAFSNWITPAASPKRFDTHFFLAAVSSDQVARPDGRESVEVLWTTPEAAMADADAGTRRLMAPTHLNLRKLGRHASVDEALAAARNETVTPVTPVLVTTETGSEIQLPESAGYGITRYQIGKIRF